MQQRCHLHSVFLTEHAGEVIGELLLLLLLPGHFSRVQLCATP